jgi:hypothetical protein
LAAQRLRNLLSPKENRRTTAGPSPTRETAHPLFLKDDLQRYIVPFGNLCRLITAGLGADTLNQDSATTRFLVSRILDDVISRFSFRQ